jgi:hypothetical protein
MVALAEKYVAEKSNLKIRAATATAYVYGNDISLSWP